MRRVVLWADVVLPSTGLTGGCDRQLQPLELIRLDHTSMLAIGQHAPRFRPKPDPCHRSVGPVDRMVEANPRRLGRWRRVSRPAWPRSSQAHLSLEVGFLSNLDELFIGQGDQVAWICVRRPEPSPE